MMAPAPRRAEQARAGPMVAMRDEVTVRPIIIDSNRRFLASLKDSDMAQLIVRNLEPEFIHRLKLRAVQHGRSMEAEHRGILRQAVLAPESGVPLKALLLVAVLVGLVGVTAVAAGGETMGGKPSTSSTTRRRSTALRSSTWPFHHLGSTRRRPGCRSRLPSPTGSSYAALAS
jgi:plasmid stability protein